VNRPRRLQAAQPPRGSRCIPIITRTIFFVRRMPRALTLFAINQLRGLGRLDIALSRVSGRWLAVH
jgi:hypothetical protein